MIKRFACALALSLTLVAGTAAAEPFERINQVGRHFQTCFNPPAEFGAAGYQATVRFSLRRDGALLGEPKITHLVPPAETPQGKALAAAALRAIAACAPAPLSPALGAAVAGRPFTMRFVHTGGKAASLLRIDQPRYSASARVGSPLKRILPDERRELVPGSRIRRSLAP